MMQQEIIDRLVNEVLLRMRPRALVLLTAADGYKEIIQARLQQCQTLSPVILFAGHAHEFHTEEEWCQIGPIVRWQEIQKTGALDNIDKVLIPFLDFATVAEVANGLLFSECAQLIHLAHSSGKPIMALDYNFNPASELNQLKGLHHGQENNSAGLAARGIQISTLDQMLAVTTKTSPTRVETALSYITLSELKRRNGHYPAGAKLTDLALEYSRDKNKSGEKPLSP
ncbi:MULTISPECIES: hypothetical protein [unclassified Serratia (in: enterobacteria)]|uniref:hypothetical protein n=1 Tax=unclassified Serratia (in: enterobacteria) TaxID=2647522 RepID=UPI0030763B8C